MSDPDHQIRLTPAFCRAGAKTLHEAQAVVRTMLCADGYALPEEGKLAELHSNLVLASATLQVLGAG